MENVTNVQKKALHFMTAMLDVYRDEEDRELGVLGKLELGDDVTEDFTAMLLAMRVMSQELTGVADDLIGFTHTLNRLAIQHCFDTEGTEHG